MAVQIASRGLSDGTVLAFVPLFFVRLLNSFEQVPVPRVTEIGMGPTINSGDGDVKVGI